MYNYIFTKMSQSLIEAFPVSVSVIGEHVREGVTRRALGDLSMLDHHFLHKGGELKFSTVLSGETLKTTDILYTRMVTLASSMILQPPALPSSISASSRMFSSDAKCDSDHPG